MSVVGEPCEMGTKYPKREDGFANLPFSDVAEEERVDDELPPGAVRRPSNRAYTDSAKVKLLHSISDDPKVQVLFSLRTLVFEHGLGLLGVTLSYSAVLFFRAVDQQYTDNSFFKALGLLLGLLLSSRAKNALQQRQKLVNSVFRMICSAKNVMDIMGSTAQKEDAMKLVVYKEFLLEQVAREISRAQPCTMDDVPEQLQEYREAIQYRACCSGAEPRHLSTRALILLLRTLCDQAFDVDKRVQPDLISRVDHIRRYHKLIDLEMTEMLTCFDSMCFFEQELAVTYQMRCMISLIIFLYAGFYPWCVQDESAVVLGITTFLIAFVFYVLDGLTLELEDPLSAHGQGMDLRATMVAALHSGRAQPQTCQTCAFSSF